MHPLSTTELAEWAVRLVSALTGHSVELLVPDHSEWSAVLEDISKQFEAVAEGKFNLARQWIANANAADVHAIHGRVHAALMREVESNLGRWVDGDIPSNPIDDPREVVYGTFQREVNMLIESLGRGEF